MKTLSRLVLSLIVASMLMGATACSGSSDDVATVNGTSITRADFDKVFEMAKAQNPGAFEGSEESTMILEYKRSLLDTLMENELIRQAAEEEGADISDADVQEQIDAIVSGFADQATFDQALADAGMTMDDLRLNVRDQLMYQYLYDKVAPAVTPTDAEIAAYYEENMEQFATPAQSQLSHILFATDDKATAEKVLAELKGGADFAELAKQYSIDTGSGANGGDLGLSSTDAYVTEFADAADALKVGEMSGLVESQFGWHIILKVDEQPAAQQTLEEASATISNTLGQQGRNDAFIAYMDKFKADSEIVVLDETLKASE